MIAIGFALMVLYGLCWFATLGAAILATRWRIRFLAPALWALLVALTVYPTAFFVAYFPMRWGEDDIVIKPRLIEDHGLAQWTALVVAVCAASFALVVHHRLRARRERTSHP